MISAINEGVIGRLVPAFYGKVRQDPVLGPVFNGAVKDWDDHLLKLQAFWSSVMLGAGSYKGNPLAAHGGHGITPPMFETWLRLWHETASELLRPDDAKLISEKTIRIAESLQRGLFYRPTT